MGKTKQKIAVMCLVATIGATSLLPDLIVSANPIEKETNQIYMEETVSNSTKEKSENSLSKVNYRTVDNTESIDELIAEYGDLNNVPIDTDNIESSPFYNNAEYYSSSEDERAVSITMLTTIVLRTAWKTGVPQKFIKWVSGAVATGIIGNVAYNGLPKVNPKTQYVGYGYYEAGNIVKTAQFALRSHGYDIKADGYYGGATRAAIIKFQEKEHISADGIIGKVTWERLYK